MTSKKLELLQSILSLSSKLTSKALPRSKSISSPSPIPSLLLPRIDCTASEEELKKRALSSKTVKDLLSLYQEHARRVADLIETTHEQVLHKIHSTSPTQEYVQQLISLFQVRYMQAIKALESSLFQNVDSRIAKFHADAEASSSEEEGNPNGGHSQDCNRNSRIRLLEMSEHFSSREE